MTGMQDGLSTKAGRTEWDAQMGPETDEVGAAHGRLQDELDARQDAEKADGSFRPRP